MQQIQFTFIANIVRFPPEIASMEFSIRDFDTGCVHCIDIDITEIKLATAHPHFKIFFPSKMFESCKSDRVKTAAQDVYFGRH